MSIENDFHEAMLEIYQQAGKEAGYWARRFLRAVKQHGGLEYAHRMLLPRKNNSIQSGLQALIDVGRVDISVETLVLRTEFSSLFSDIELQEARRRLDGLPDYAKRKDVSPDLVFPETLPQGLPYIEGAVRKITINAYERDQNARAACLAKHGYSCAVCTMNFKDKYGFMGEGFIHVHHKKPLATIRSEYKLDPAKDLVRVLKVSHKVVRALNLSLQYE